MMKAVEVEYDAERPVIEAIQQGDGYAMSELIRRQGRWLRGAIYAVTGRIEDVDDVAQRVWIQVWRQASSLEDPSRWRAWLYRIARNAATDRGRAQARRRRGIRQVAQERPALATPPPDENLIAQERQAAVLDAIAALPEMYREPFVLKHLENWSYRQIGQLLGLPEDTVETRLVRARRRLREQLGGKV